VAVDADRNDATLLRDPHQPDADITAAGAPVRTLVVRSREDLQIASGVEQALAPGSARG
jgi:acetate kinase